MLKQERFRRILETLDREGQVRLAPLSETLDVSTDTVRRDLAALARQGSLTQVRGGALPISRLPSDYRVRERQDIAAKQQIARKAFSLIEDGQLIMLDGGTTAECLARLLHERQGLTVATNSFPVVTALLDHPDVEVLFAGGKLQSDYQVTLGQETVDFFRQLRAAWCFLGTYGLHPDAGLTVTTDEEASVKRAMVQSAQRVAAMVTTDKLGKAEPYVVAEIGEVHTLVTADDVTTDQLRVYWQKNIQLL